MKAVLPVLDESKAKPYYLQLYQYIRQGILEGEFGEGEKLPSLRNLAKSTGLSITTIEQAYNQLLVEGYISSKPNSGYYISNVFSHSNLSAPARKETVHEKNDFSEPELLSLDFAADSAAPEMQYDPECFDFNKWKKCMNKILTEYSSTLFFEGNPQGEPALRIEIARYLYMSRGVSCSPDQIIIGAGTQQIIGQLAILLRKQGIEHVALENPGYVPVRNAFRDRGFAITSVDVTDNGLLIEKLPANIRTAAYVSPSNNAFTGSVMPVARRYELLNWAEANNSYIIEDDYDSELRYFGRPIPALKSLGSGDRVVYLGSFSSTLFAAVKISYMVLPKKMASAFSEMARDYSQTCSKLEQLSLAMFMETGNYQTHIKKLRKLYSLKLACIVEEFHSQASDFINVINKSSGINIALQVSSRRPAKELKKDAESLGIPCVFIGNSAGGKGSASLILYYNQIPLAEIPEAVSRLVSLWR